VVLTRRTNSLTFSANVTVRPYDEFSAEPCRQTLHDADHVIYSIGIPAQFVFDEKLFERTNCELLWAFLQEFKRAGGKNLTYISTYEVFEEIDGIIRESHPIAQESSMTPYFRSMTRAYRECSNSREGMISRSRRFTQQQFYGGLNTGYGLTNYIENLRNRRFWAAPLIIDGKFPIVHVHSLADAILRSLGHPGSFIVSDDMTTFKRNGTNAQKTCGFLYTSHSTVTGGEARDEDSGASCARDRQASDHGVRTARVSNERGGTNIGKGDQGVALDTTLGRGGVEEIPPLTATPIGEEPLVSFALRKAKLRLKL